jgi:hypothetical protein
MYDDPFLDTLYIKLTELCKANDNETILERLDQSGFSFRYLSPFDQGFDVEVIAQIGEYWLDCGNWHDHYEVDTDGVSKADELFVIISKLITGKSELKIYKKGSIDHKWELLIDEQVQQRSLGITGLIFYNYFGKEKISTKSNKGPKATRITKGSYKTVTYYFYFANHLKANAEKLGNEMQSDGYSIDIHQLPDLPNHAHEWSVVACKDYYNPQLSLIHKYDDKYEELATMYGGSYDGHDMPV